MNPGLGTLLDLVHDDDDMSSPPTGDAKSSSPPPADDTKSSPPSPDSSSPPPASSPPPPDSSPPPPASSPPPQKSESPPPPEEDSPSPPPPKEESPPSPPPTKEESPPSPPPPKEESPPSPPPPDKTPSPEKSPEKSPTAPPPTTSLPPPSGGTPPAMIVLQSPPPPGQQSATASPPHSPAEKLTPPSRSGSGSSTTPPSASSSSSVNAGVIAAAAVIGVGLLAALILCLVCAVMKKKRKQYYMDGPENGKGDYFGTSNWNTQQNLRPPPGLMGTPSNGFSNWPPPQGPFSGEHSSGFSGPHPMGTSPNLALNNQSSFSYEELARATNGFAQENVIGQGGFGYVHKGVLPNGKEVAVKSLKSGSGQGDREFQAEVEIISRVHHRHLVSLVGYCVVNEQRMLVYEFVPNKTLEFHLHGKGQPIMQWSTRMRIALGAAKGLAYLHEDCHPKIIHRDIKAANILLDFNFEAMVADFGLAKLTSDTNTHVSTRVMGTFGYMAPEYASSGKLTDKSDVFSFGVMLLELITGRKPIDLTNQTMEDSLVDWARPLLGQVLEDGNYGELVDPLLENNFDPHEMDRMIACAAASVRHSARRRPKMAQIVRSLEGDHSSLDDTAIKQGQTPESSAYDTRAYNADMMKFKKMVMTGNDTSGEFEQTSDYGLHPSSSSSELGSREFTNSGPQAQRL